MKDALLIIRDQLTMGYKLSFAEAMLLQQAIDVAVNHVGDSVEKVEPVSEPYKLPAELPPHENESYGSEDDCYKAGKVDGWNEYRATMLASVSTPTKAGE